MIVDLDDNDNSDYVNDGEEENDSDIEEEEDDEEGLFGFYFGRSHQKNNFFIDI